MLTRNKLPSMHPSKRPRSCLVSSNRRPLYFLGLLAGSTLTLFIEGGFGTLAGGNEVAETLGNPLTPPTTGAFLIPLTPGGLGNPSTGALGSPPLVFGLLAALTLAFPGTLLALLRGLETTGGRDEVDGLGVEGLVKPFAEGMGLPLTTAFGLDAAETACFFAAPA